MCINNYWKHSSIFSGAAINLEKKTGFVVSLNFVMVRRKLGVESPVSEMAIVIWRLLQSVEIDTIYRLCLSKHRDPLNPRVYHHSLPLTLPSWGFIPL